MKVEDFPPCIGTRHVTCLLYFFSPRL